MAPKIINFTDEPVVRAQNLLGEGPVWSVADQALYWVDILRRQIHTLDPETSKHSVEQFDRRLGSIVLRQGDPGFACGAELDICVTNPSKPGTLEAIVSNPIPKGDGYANTDRFNDGVCDARGRYVTGTMGREEGAIEGGGTGGQLYSIESTSDGEFKARVILDGVTCSNGTGFSPDNKTMYYVDSAVGNIRTFDYDLETGNLSGERVFATNTFGDSGAFDGLCMDAEGGVWVARWGSSRIAHYTPDGALTTEIRFPKARNITCCIFGGKDLDELYVTTASCEASGQKEDVPQWPEGGDLYVVKGLGVKGVEKFKFSG